MKLNLNAIKKYCINLERRPDRRAHVFEQFDRHHLTVERFPAIDGFDFIKKDYPASLANNGCTLSHYFLIERAQLLGLPAIIIFEDDAELHPDFCKIMDRMLAELPSDWDLVMFGGTHIEKPKPFTEHLLKISKTFTTHGYLMRDTMYQIAIDNLKKLDVPVDCHFVDWMQIKNVFVTEPPVAWQREGHSDINGRKMNYDWIKSNHQQ